MKKRARLMLALALIMCVNVVVGLAQPTNPSDFDFNPEYGMITGYHGQGGEVTIPERIDGVLVAGIGSRAFHGNKNITKVTLPYTVSYIGDSAFARCAGLQMVEFSDGSEMKMLGNSAFAGCERLMKINLPEGIKHIPVAAFKGCCNLVFLRLPEGLETVGHEAFAACSSLPFVKLPATVKVVRDSAFRSCLGLSSVYFQGNETKLGDHVFDFFRATTQAYEVSSSLKVIVFAGSQDKWNTMVEGTDNITLVNNPNLEIIFEG